MLTPVKISGFGGYSILRATFLLILVQLIATVAVYGEQFENELPAPSSHLAPASGTIVKCGLCSLNRQPVLKEFLLEGGAEAFEDLTVVDFPGNTTRKTVLTVYDQPTGQVREVLELQPIHYNTTESLEGLLLEMGFVRKSQDEIARIQAKYRKQAEEANVGKSGKDLRDGELREHLMNEAWNAAEALKRSSYGDELNELSRQIKDLKQIMYPTEEIMASIKDLEQKRLLLLRQQMLTRQFQIPPEKIKTGL